MDSTSVSLGNVRLKGNGIVDGIALANAFVITSTRLPVSQRQLMGHEVDHEVERFQKAIKAVRMQLQQDRERVANQLGTAEADIFESHLAITEDPFFSETVPELIIKDRRNSEWIILDKLNEYIERFGSVDNPFFKERLADIKDVTFRILGSLQIEKEQESLACIEGILVAKELMPSMIMNIDVKKVKGIISEHGGRTSHAVILAKSLHIPVVVNVQDATEKIRTGDFTIVDGHTGRVIVNPSEAVTEAFTEAENEYHLHIENLKKTSGLPPVTKDGVRIKLYANIEGVMGLSFAQEYGAEGIGLFRTELPFIMFNKLMSEEEQFRMYRTLTEEFEDKPVTIRTLDIGGDKFLSFQNRYSPVEANPFLGLRSIRLSLLNPDIFRTQIRAILRTSHYGKINILLPMISSYEELEQSRAIIEEEKEGLRKEGVSFDDQIKIGIMIEVPSAALSAPHIIQHCDFFSIGTNDLIQYTLAADRANEKVSAYYTAENPAVLKLIEISAQSAVKNQKPCSVCGELAGNPLFTPFFLGIGITELSMEPSQIPEVNQVIRNMAMAEAKKLSDELLEYTKVDEIKNALAHFYHTHSAVR
ncbi:phosphoenolpyruvate--protein phosphotransferase [Candidatus Poribacteria bacterium]